MKARSHILSPCTARGITILCAAFFVTSAHIARAGINVWTSHGPGVTSVWALAIDRTAPGTLYASSRGRVFKSTDGAMSWQAANTGLTDPTFFAIAIDPRTPSTLYAAGGGVFKSTDRAGSWQAANTGLPPDFVYALVLDPTGPGTLYAGTYGGGVFKSTGGASSWQAVNTSLFDVRALAVDPSTPSTLYAVASTCDSNVGCSSYGVFKSMDGASSWKAVNAGLNSSVVSELAPGDVANIWPISLDMVVRVLDCMQ